ncbi:MAG: hypothetical protein A3J79_08390 [Elusimicrobia bacterium RIFOXYB2_FULL_62_6]|nr:MAG: hypothetical protein A3J79_08390 [Elusimicrobia bacterium RIFOXYB2_FULL_62_6]
MKILAAAFFLATFPPLAAFAQEAATGTVTEAAPAAGTDKAHFEIELDPYYASVGLYKSLTGKPIPHMGAANEVEISRELIKKFYLPRTMVLEASINPLPSAGSLIHRHQPSLYHKADVSETLNAIEALTAGFEEPWALSLFFGNVITFDTVKGSFQGKRTGYSGFLINAGNYHIQHNRLIKDNWFELEGKLKGEQYLSDRTLRWSFRGGLKSHQNRYVSDSFYVGFRRSRTDFEGSNSFWMNNSGFEYVADFSQRNLKPIRHFFLVEKKFPVGKRKMLSVGTGFIWTSGDKYSGPLTEADSGRSDFQVMLRPNLEF